MDTRTEPMSQPVKQYASLAQVSSPPPPKTKEGEVPGIGLVRVKELHFAEREEVTDPQRKTGVNDKGEFAVVLDNRGMKARAIVLASIKADGSPFFPDQDAGMTLVGNWPRDTVEAWYQLVDDLNVFNPVAQKALGKDSGTTTSAAG